MRIYKSLCFLGVLFSFFILLLSCASQEPTPYQPRFDTVNENFQFSSRRRKGEPEGGYMENEINPGIWRVRYYGNKHTSADTTYNYALYRAAEITTLNNHDYFTVLNRQTSYDVIRGSSVDFGLVNVESDTIVERLPKTSLTVQLKIGKFPSTDSNSYRPDKIFKKIPIREPEN